MFSITKVCNFGRTRSSAAAKKKCPADTGARVDNFFQLDENLIAATFSSECNFFSINN